MHRTAVSSSLISLLLVLLAVEATADSCALADTLRANGLTSGDTLDRVDELCEEERSRPPSASNEKVTSGTTLSEEGLSSPLLQCRNAQRYPDDTRLVTRCEEAIATDKRISDERAAANLERERERAIRDNWRTSEIEKIEANDALDLVQKKQAIARLSDIPDASLKIAERWLRSCHELRSLVDSGAENRHLESIYFSLRHDSGNLVRAFEDYPPALDRHREALASCKSSEEYVAVASMVRKNETYAREQRAMRAAENEGLRRGIETRAIQEGYVGVHWAGINDFLDQVKDGKRDLKEAATLVFPLKGADKLFSVSQILEGGVFYRSSDTSNDHVLVLPRQQGAAYLEGSAITTFSDRAYFRFIGTGSYSTVLGATAQALAFEPVF